MTHIVAAVATVLSLVIGTPSFAGPTPANNAEGLPTPAAVDGSEHTGAGTSGGPAGYTGTGRAGTVTERGNDDNSEPAQMEITTPKSTPSRQ